LVFEQKPGDAADSARECIIEFAANLVDAAVAIKIRDRLIAIDTCR
jgi:hypothetical protein